jgi:hypothetical protein
MARGRTNGFGSRFRLFDKVGYEAILEARRTNQAGDPYFARAGKKSFCETCQQPKPKRFPNEKVCKGWKCADCRKPKP